MSLSDARIRGAKPKEKPYKLADAFGLYLLVNPTGSKLWRMNYRADGKQRTLSFGRYPIVTLAEARVARDEARRRLAKGDAPVLSSTPAPGVETFRQVATRWFIVNKDRWVSDYYLRLHNRMTSDVFPTLGDKPIDAISPKDVLDTVRKVEARSAVEMGRRINQMIGQVFRFAIAENLVTVDPSRDIGAALAPKSAVKHRATMPASELPAFMLRLRDYSGDPVTQLALRFVAHTIVRTNELRMATWGEFEGLGGDNPLWRIPAMKMKMRRDHIVPLSRQTVEIIMDLRQHNGGRPWVFASPNDKGLKPISANTMIYALYRLGYHSRATVHGFRSSASTALNEHEFNRDWVELQLAHVDASIRGVYNSALYLRQRREMMQWWSDLLEPPEKGLFDDLL